MKYDTGISKIEIHDYLLAMLFSTLEKVNFLFFFRITDILISD